MTKSALHTFAQKNYHGIKEKLGISLIKTSVVELAYDTSLNNLYINKNGE